MADGSNTTHIAGADRDDWSLNLCAEAEGNSESEAFARLDRLCMERVDGTLWLTNSEPDARD